MLGFCLSFIVAEVIPLFLITLFTVIEYDVGDGEMAVWLVVSQFIAIGSIAPFVGPLVDLFGRKFMTLGSLLLVVVAMILLGTATNITGMLAMTILSGMGIGIQFLTVIAAVTELVPVYKRGITVGYIVMGFLPFAPASLYGQLLAEKGYRWIGLVVGSMALIAFAILITWYKPPPRVNTIGLSNREKASRLDYIGAVLGIGGVTTFLVGLNWGGQKYPWSSVHVITALTLGLVSLLAFGIWEKCGAKYPMFPKALAHRPRLFIASTFLCLTSGINYSAAIVFWIIQVYTVYGASFVQAGVYSLPIGFCISGGAIISAIMMTAFKRHIQWVLLLFCVLQTTGDSTF
jgi:MFS family permease